MAGLCKGDSSGFWVADTLNIEPARRDRFALNAVLGFTAILHSSFSLPSATALFLGTAPRRFPPCQSAIRVSWGQPGGSRRVEAGRYRPAPL